MMDLKKIYIYTYVKMDERWTRYEKIAFLKVVKRKEKNRRRKSTLYLPK